MSHVRLARNLIVFYLDLNKYRDIDMWAPCRCRVDTFVQYNHNSLLAGSVDCDKSNITFFPMKIICAGFPKTGTKSMAAALRELGYSVNDFPEHLHGGLFFCQSNLVVKKLKMI